MTFLPPSAKSPRHHELPPKLRSEVHELLKGVQRATYRSDPETAFRLLRAALQIVTDGSGPDA